MPEAGKKFTVLVEVNGEMLGPFATGREATDQGKAAQEGAIIEWGRQVLERLIREPELMKKIVALLALTRFEGELDSERHRELGPLATFTGLKRPSKWIKIQEVGMQGQTGQSLDFDADLRGRIVAAILALDLDKE